MEVGERRGSRRGQGEGPRRYKTDARNIGCGLGDKYQRSVRDICIMYLHRGGWLCGPTRGGEENGEEGKVQVLTKPIVAAHGLRAGLQVPAECVWYLFNTRTWSEGNAPVLPEDGTSQIQPWPSPKLSTTACNTFTRQLSFQRIPDAFCIDNAGSPRKADHHIPRCYHQYVPSQ